MSVESSRQAFLSALERLLVAGSEAEPGVNAVAKEARLNKVLLYRYFGSWEGLLEEFARKVNPWRELRLESEQGFTERRWPNAGSYLKWLFRSYLARLETGLLPSLLSRALSGQDPLQKALESDREREGQLLAAAAANQFDIRMDDPLATVAILTGGLTWVSLHGRKAGVFNGLGFHKGGDGPERLAAAADRWIDALTGDQS